MGKRGRHRLSKRRYVATFGPAEEVGLLTYAAACDLGAPAANQQVVLGDGAAWIKTQATEHFPEAVKVLDWPHLGRHPCALLFARSSRANVLPDAPGAREQYEVLLPLLWEGERQQALTHLHNVRPITGEVPPPLQEAIRYLEIQKDWIGNYQQWQADGYPVGSDLVERAVAVVINMRMKKRGMRLPANQCHCGRGFTRPAYQC